MNRRVFAASALSTALGLVMATQGLPTLAQGMDMSKAPGKLSLDYLLWRWLRPKPGGNASNQSHIAGLA
jgi:hypothetical protein